MARVVRPGLTLLGMLLALAWSVLFVKAPGAAMEPLIAAAPVVVAVWLIVMLTASKRPVTRVHRAPAPQALTDQERAAVRARDGGVCGLCGAAGAHAVAARRPAHAGEADRLARFIAICAACAAGGPLGTTIGASEPSAHGDA